MSISEARNFLHKKWQPCSFINEFLEHKFFRFACFVFIIVAELKLLSGCLSSLEFQVLTVWSGGLSKFKITDEEEQSITKKTKLEP